MQFELRQMIAFMSATAVLFALSAWLYKSNSDMSLGWIRPLFEPSIAVMGFCIAVLPFVCLPLFLTLIILVSVNSPRPYLAIVFLGLQVTAVFIDVSYWSNGVRLATTMFVVAIAMTVEIHWRKLPAVYRIFAAIAFALTFGWYIASIGIAASAAV